MKSLSLPSLSSLSAVTTLSTLLSGCESIDDSKLVDGEINFQGVECEPLEPGEAETPHELTIFLETGAWANRVRSTLNDEGLTAVVFPSDFPREECYAARGILPQADQSFRFHMPFPQEERGELWQVWTSYPDEVYGGFEEGYTDPSGGQFDSWQLGCFHQDSPLKPEDNYGYVYVQDGETVSYLQTQQPDPKLCDLRFEAPRVH